MRKSAFRPRPIPSPSYPDLERFEQERRSFLAALGAAVLGSALLAPLGAEAGTPDKKGKKKKKKGEGEGDPEPPKPGGKGPPRSRLDAVEDAAWREAAARPPKDDAKKGKKKKDKPPAPPPPAEGNPPHPRSRLDEAAEG